MSNLSFPLPEVGQPDKTEDPKIVNALKSIIAWAGGSIDSSNLAANGVNADRLAAAVLEALGLNTEATKRRGHCVIPTEQTRESTVFGTLATPDEVTVTLPENGLIYVWYEATVKASAVSNAGSLALFLGENQLHQLTNEPAPVPMELKFANLSNAWVPVNGLASVFGGNSGYSGDVETGMVNVPITIWAAAGTYKLSIRYKSVSGNITAKNRRLRAKVEAF